MNSINDEIFGANNSTFDLHCNFTKDLKFNFSSLPTFRIVWKVPNDWEKNDPWSCTHFHKYRKKTILIFQRKFQSIFRFKNNSIACSAELFKFEKKGIEIRGDFSSQISATITWPSFRLEYTQSQQRKIKIMNCNENLKIELSGKCYQRQ